MKSPQNDRPSLPSLSEQNSHLAAGPTPPRSRGRVWRRVGIVVLLGLSGWLAWAAWTEVRAEALLRQAEAAYKRGNWPAALRNAQDQIKLRPRNARGALLAALCLTRLSKPEEAEPYYRKAGPLLELDDQHRRAFALIQAQRADDAASVYGQILRRWPNDVMAMRRLAAIHISRNRWDHALKLAERLMQIPSAEVTGQTLKGAVFHNLGVMGIVGAFSEAIDADHRVLQLDPDLREMPLPGGLFWYQFSYDLLREGKTAEARATLDRALAQNEDAALIDLLGQVYMKEGDLERAEQCWRRAVELDHSRGDPWLNLGKLALRRQQPQEAIRLLTRATELLPESIDTLYNLSQAYRLAGNHAEANRLQQRVQRLRPVEAMPQEASAVSRADASIQGNSSRAPKD